MQNTQVSTSTPSASSVDSNMTEGLMGRLGNFNAGMNGYKTALTPPEPMKTDITADIK